MTYNSIESSKFSAEPVALYEFRHGSKTWRYALSEQNITVDGDVFVASNVKDAGTSQSGSPESEDVVITMPRSGPIPQLFLAIPPSETVDVTIKRINRGFDEAPVYWVGSIKTMKQNGLLNVDFTCLMMASSFKRQGLRLGYQRGCPHALYDRRCTVSKLAWRVPFTIQEMDGQRLISDVLDNLPTGRLAGGFIEWSTSLGSTERRAIEKHDKKIIEIMEGTTGLILNQNIYAFPGCPRTIVGCQSFNNVLNYGGFPHMPGKSPFDGDPVF